MPYDIDLIEMACEEYGMSYSRGRATELHITIAPGVIMVVANTDDDDTYWGFTDVVWHTHDELSLTDGETGYATYLPEDMIAAWSKGMLLLVSTIEDGEVIDRRFALRGDTSDLDEIALGQSLLYTTASHTKSNKQPTG